MSFTGQKGFAVGHANVEDVPFKVGEQCVPPKKVTMPLNFEMGNPTEALFMEYDFGLESKVLEWVEAQDRLRNEAAAASKARAKAVEEAAAAAKAAAEQAAAEQAAAGQAAAEAAQRQAEEEQKAKETITTTQETSAMSQQPAAFAGFSNGGILVPTVLSNSAPSNDKNSAQATNSTNSQFDLSDFERAQDPFDKVELEVIDAMAELNKVLQVTQPVSQAATEGNNCGTNSQSSIISENSRPVVAPKPTVTKSLKDVDYPDIDTLASSDSCVTLSTTDRGASAAYYKPSSNPNNPFVSSTPSNSFTTQSPALPPIPTASNLVQQPNNAVYSVNSGYTPFANYPPTTSQQQAANPNHNPWGNVYGHSPNMPTYMQNRNNNSPTCLQNSNNNSPSNGMMADGVTTGQPLSQSLQSSSFTGLRSARSTPDIHGLVGEEQAHGEKRPYSHTPPPIRNHTPPPVAAKPAASKDISHHKPLPPLPPSRPHSGSPKPSRPPPRPSQPPPRPQATPARRPAPSLPDPYWQMNPQLKQLVNNITDMGFQRARVARTVEKLGDDERKVVDHLFAITKLEDAGFPPDLAETALQLFENDADKAKQFLTLLKQFMEYGFKEEKVRDALIKNNLDEHKTLDCLTAS